MSTRYLAIFFIAMFGTVALVNPPAQALTMKECSAKYKAAKDAGTLGNMKWNDFRKAECGSEATAAPAATPSTTKQDTATKPTTTPATATPSTTKQTPAPKPTATTSTAPAGANQFTSEALAKGHCPSDTIVWVNLSSKIYHFSGNKSYGATKNGTYMCEKDATGAAFRAAKNEKHP